MIRKRYLGAALPIINTNKNLSILTLLYAGSGPTPLKSIVVPIQQRTVSAEV